MSLNEFEREVIEQLATLEERTRDLPQVRTDIAAIHTKVAVLETRASIFGAGAGALVAIIVAFFKSLIGRS